MRMLSLALAAALLFGATPANADVFDKINGFLDKVNSKLEPLAQPSVATPGINPSASGTVLAAKKDDKYYGYGEVPTGNPETRWSRKALEAMALLGDKWAKMKLDELNALEFYNAERARYESISWFNIFKKAGAWFDQREARKYYENARERVAEYEKANPNAGGIVEGIDQVNESILEVKALFGDKKAKAQLELIRAKREYDRLTYEYERANLFQKMGMKNELDYAKRRYEQAVINYQRITGKPAAGVVAPGSPAGTLDGIFRKDVAQVPASNNAAMTFAKDQMEAAYKRYTAYLSTTNPDPQRLAALKAEYEMTLKEYNRLQGR